MTIRCCRAVTTTLRKRLPDEGIQRTIEIPERQLLTSENYYHLIPDIHVRPAHASPRGLPQALQGTRPCLYLPAASYLRSRSRLAWTSDPGVNLRAGQTANSFSFTRHHLQEFKDVPGFRSSPGSYAS